MASPYAVHDPLAGDHAFLFYWLLAHSGYLDSLLFGSANFLSFLLALVISFSYVGFLSSPFWVLSVLRFVRILGFPPL